MQNQRLPVVHRQKISPVEVYWKTVTYRTVAIYMLLVLAIVMATLYLIYPEAYSGVAAKISDALGGGPKAAAEMSVKQAKFVNLDGRVQVKKVNSVQWVAADYRMALDKGDLIQTSGDGAARGCDQGICTCQKNAAVVCRPQLWPFRKRSFALAK